MNPHREEGRARAIEADLFDPIRIELERQGYTVRAEVEHCDIVAYGGGKLVIVELKSHFSIDLLAQAVARQRISDTVYVAVPRRAVRDRRRLRRITRLLRRLELGLLLVDLEADPPSAKAAIEPSPFRRRSSSALRARVLEEMVGRSGTRNRGGVTRTKLMTAYRENALQIAVLIDELGPQSPRSLRERGTGEKTAAILQRNVYGWFRRVARGLYDLSADGRAALAAHPKLAMEYRRGLRDDTPPASMPEAR